MASAGLRPTHPCTPAEERANAWTHGIATACAIGLLVALVVAAASDGEPRRIVSVSIFGASLVLLYAASTCYHACPPDRLHKHQLRAIDHAAIFLLIAGSYTPFLLVLVRGAWGWSMLSVVWVLAIIGVATKLRSISEREWISTLLYLSMGWIGIVAAKPFFGVMSGGCIAWILAGGMAYTLGVIFFVWDRLPFNHAVWHLFVTAGSACHVVAVVRYVLPLDAGAA